MYTGQVYHENVAEPRGLGGNLQRYIGTDLVRGSFFNGDDLIGAIQEYINVHNHDAKPFIWTATAKDTLAKVKRAQWAQEKAL